MKRILSYILLLCTSVIVGCTQEQLVPSADKDCIVLYFSSAGKSAFSAPVTKAGTVPGVSNYNENLISTVDVFFYPDDGTDSDAVKYVTGRAVEQISDVLYKVTIRYTSADAMNIFRSESDGTARVFVIANASISYDGESTSVSALKQKMVERDFSAQMLQGSFVMYSDDNEDTTEGYPITMTSGTISGRIPMNRVAAKAQIFVMVPAELEGENAGEIWKPETSAMRVYLANGVKRSKINAPYTVAIDGSDYFNVESRPLYDLSTSLDSDDMTLYTEVSAINENSSQFKYTSFPFYSYPASWRDIHDHATQYIIEIPWYIQGSDVPASPRYYQISANTVSSMFERNHYYRTYAEIRSLGGIDIEQSVTITDCSYLITPWIKAGSEANGFPVEGDFETQAYLVVEPSRVILNNEDTAEFTYLSSTALSSANTKVTKVVYYNYYNSTDPIIRDTPNAISNDSNTNSTAIKVDISEAGKVTVTHKLYNDDGSQKIFVEYDITVRIENSEGLYEYVTISQRPPLYVLMKDGDNAFIDGYFRHVQKTGGGAPFANAYAHTESEWSGFYRSASYYRGHDYTTPVSGYGFVGIRNSNSTTYFANGQSSYIVFTPYGNMSSSPGGGGLNLYSITGIKLSAFSEMYNSYTVKVNFIDGTSVNEPVQYRIGDPRVPNDFSGSPKLVDYLTGMGSNYTTPYTNVRRYPITTAAWNDKADAVMMGVRDHNENSLIAPYILISSSYISMSGASGYGVTFEEAQKRCATYQEGGYPAGRWRLPTEAEIMFIVSRQKDNTIPVLLNVDLSNGYYWAASGFYFINGELHESRDGNEDGACRCVYDAWFWGDEPVAAAAYTYTPMP